ncbi:hypothetical protein DOK67_0000250 [Enterococcus sp. DIV0212c]|uniref:hypothetical protein n=1 Tax=Enterococcus sp. DIV0212c TaxID=2230867 RepID=UPI001A9B32A0|nr:hypothetical protein [Enterococcus sp. DIV0212c]MBO1352801.1 hypothetical protein [Enterococcus sp. DIV0212c]
MEKIKKNKKYYVMELLLIISYVIYLMFFLYFYKEAVFYVDDRASMMTQILFLTTFYLREILIYLFVAFLLITLQLLFFVYLYSMMKSNSTVKSDFNWLLIVSILTFSSYSLGLFLTKIGILFLIIFIFSVSIAYATYVIVKLGKEKELMIQEENILEIDGPFNTENEVLYKFEEFSENWSGPEKLSYMIECENREEYYITIYIETDQKDEEHSYEEKMTE